MTPGLLLTIGLPCSGKSTWGESMRQQRPESVRIVNRDDIRSSTGCRFDDGDEPLVEEIRDVMIKGLLRRGYLVICTDTNLSPRVRSGLHRLAAECNVKSGEVLFRTPLDVCLSRNEARWRDGDCRVPSSVIRRMADQFADQLING